ncbi:MAG TPA: hypothetical protein VMR74_05345 [Gammaproteobacteria bacterium]|nr:hypothetical protein [Gammaproteobacteria bacterium]
MLSRREVLRNGLALSAMSALPAGEAFSALHLRLAAGIVDANLPAAARMAERFRRESAALHVFAGDPGRLWMSVIEPALRRRPEAIAGFTGAATLFCFQYLAQGYGLGLAARAAGPAALDRLDVAEPDLLDLRDPRLADADTVVTWILAPKRG